MIFLFPEFMKLKKSIFRFFGTIIFAFNHLIFHFFLNKTNEKKSFMFNTYKTKL